MFPIGRAMPEKVDRCTLWQRFCAMVIPWLILNFALWLIGGFILGVIAQPICRFVLFVFVGQRLVYDEMKVRSSSPVICADRFVRLIVFSYERENIWWLDWADYNNGFRSPFVYVLVALFVGFLLYLLAIYTPTLAHFFGSYVWAAGGYMHDTAGWWGSAIAVPLTIFALILLSRMYYKKFAATESGAVVIAHIKGWRERHCTMYELVE